MTNENKYTSHYRVTSERINILCIGENKYISNSLYRERMKESLVYE